MTIEITQLAKHHERKAFDCGEPVLNDYLKKLANQHIKKGLCHVYVAELENQVIGFYSLSTSHADISQAPQQLIKGLPNYPVPALLIGRLAVDINYQKQSIGEALLLNALYQCVQISKLVGVRLILVDAKDKAKAFYAKYGFVPFSHVPSTLALSIKAAIEIVS